MKLFLYRLVLFLLPFCIIAWPADLLLSHYFRKTIEFPGETEVMNAIYEGYIDSDIAIYGSSRAWVHINPQIILDSLGKTAYNFGIDAHHFRLQYLRHLEYLKHNRKPSHIIVSLDVFSLEIRKDLYGLEQFLPYMLWNRNIINYTSFYKGFEPMDYYLPLVRYIGRRKVVTTAVSNMTADHDLPKIRTRGFAGMDKTWNSDLDNARAEMKSYKIKLHQPSVQLFKKFLRECREMNITVTLVCSPEYIEGQQFVVNRDEIIAFYQDIAKENDLLFLDFSDDELCFNRAMFYNSLHLNKTGADIFTKKLTSRLRHLN